MTVKQRIFQAVTQRQQDKGLTDREMSRRIGISPSHFSKLKKDPSRRLTVDLLLKMCGVLDASPTDLLFAQGGFDAELPTGVEEHVVRFAESRPELHVSPSELVHLSTLRGKGGAPSGRALLRELEDFRVRELVERTMASPYRDQLIQYLNLLEVAGFKKNTEPHSEAENP